MTLRSRFDNGESISAPGVFDPFTARIAEGAGFDVLYMTGYGVNATLLGEPDAAFASYGEMVERLRAIANVTDASIVADGDTGFGGLPNVARAVAGYEAAGAEAIQLEDQEFPKRCGHTKNRRVVSAQDMARKIEIAAQSRSSDDFLIVARTDALSEHGLDEALRRADHYLSAGADVLFIESPENTTQMQAICDRFKGVPLIANMVAGGRTPIPSDAELFAMGFQLVIHPIYLLGAILTGVSAAAATLKSGKEAEVADINALNTLLDFEAIWALDEKYQ